MFISISGKPSSSAPMKIETGRHLPSRQIAEVSTSPHTSLPFINSSFGLSRIFYSSMWTPITGLGCFKHPHDFTFRPRKLWASTSFVVPQSQRHKYLVRVVFGTTPLMTIKRPNRWPTDRNSLSLMSPYQSQSVFYREHCRYIFPADCHVLGAQNSDWLVRCVGFGMLPASYCLESRTGH